jgi:hypothetical protein
VATVFSSTGKAITTGRLLGGASPTQTQPQYVGIGSGAGTSAVGDTTLFTEYTTGTWTGYARAAGTCTQQTVTVTNDTYQCVATFTAPASETPTNAGIFDASSAGNLYMKGDFAGIPLSNGDSLQLTFKLTYS